MNSSSSGAGIGVPAILTIVFIILKLTHFVAWSWLWVLAPLWIPFGLGVLLLLVAGVLTVIIKIQDHHV